MVQTDLDLLIANFLHAKQKEDEWKEKRIEAAEALAAECPGPDDGSKTRDWGDYKVTVARRVNRKVNWTLFDEIPFTDPAPVLTKRELDKQGLEWYAEYSPEMYERILEVIESKPGRPTVTVKKVSK